jgi:hypothetical protein
MGLGDMFTMNGATRKLLDSYKKVIVVCKKEYINTIKQMYSDEPKIKVYPIKNIAHLADLKDPIYAHHHRYEYKFTGYHDRPTYLKLPGHFFEKFYTQLGFTYTDKHNYEKLTRNRPVEEQIHAGFLKCYGHRYIFTHDHRGYLQHYSPRQPVNIPKQEIPIFHPNINYYDSTEPFFNIWDNLWNKNIFDNLLNYCTIIENAEQIHIRDSCFSCLCPFLDLTKVKRKVLYTSFSRAVMVAYSEKFADWEFVLLK